MKPRVLAATLLLLAGVAAAQRPPGPSGPGLPPPGAPGPWDQDVHAYLVTPTGLVTHAATFERAGVPSVARLKDGRLIVAHQHFPADDAAKFDRVAVRFSKDEGRTWSAARVIEVAGLPDGMRSPFDPTLVPLGDGRVRLYFTSLHGRRFEEDVPAIYSAISLDGIRYRVEPGLRFGIQGRPVIDCAVALHRGVFHLFAPDNGGRPMGGVIPAQPTTGMGYHAVSRDGLNFTREADVRAGSRARWLGNVQSDGKRMTFFGTADPGSPEGSSLWVGTSADGREWRMESSPVVRGGDPGAVATRGGGLLLVITGPPRRRAPLNAGPPALEQQADGLLDLNQLWSNGRAAGSGPVRFSHSPMNLGDIERLVPYGLMVGGHVCPIDHGYFFPKPTPSGAAVDVISPAAGHIVVIGHRTQLAGSTERQRDYDDYALTIEHTGTFYTQYDLLTALAPEVLSTLDGRTRERFAARQPGPPVQVRIPVKAGQVVGKVAGRSLDFGVVNTQVRLPGLLNPRMYGHYAWRLHVVDPFDYFDEPIRGKLLALNARKVKPYFGKFDYDVDGRLAGNWFREGSGGYPGDRSDPRGYWMGHLACAYHPIDPTIVILSIGDFDGRPRQFAVTGNGPDPRDVSPKQGVVKYELLYSPIDSYGRRVELPEAFRGVQGVVLFQMLGNRRLRVESFPGSTASQVRGFTARAVVYER